MTLDQAAISYFGLPAHTQVMGGEVAGSFVFVVACTAEDLVGIAQRMQADAGVDEQPVFVPGPDQAQMREEYNALSQAERGKYGSFARYCVMRSAQSEGVGGRKVVHVDDPDLQETQTELPAAVWVPGQHTTELQASMSSDYDARCNSYLLRTDMLTDEQRAKYAAR